MVAYIVGDAGYVRPYFLFPIQWHLVHRGTDASANYICSCNMADI